MPQTQEIPEILAGNMAVYKVVFKPSSGVAAVTSITLRVEEPDGTSHTVTATSPDTNTFTGSYDIPDTSKNGRWIWRAESSSPKAADEAYFDVVGSGFTSP